MYRPGRFLLLGTIAVAGLFTLASACVTPGADRPQRSKSASARPRAKSWRVVSVSKTRQARLDSISAVDESDVWALGGTDFGSDGLGSKPLVLHWNGRRWTKQSTNIALSAISAVSANNVWGTAGPTDGVGPVAHYNGRKWKSVPTRGLGNNTTSTIAAAGRRVWVNSRIGSSFNVIASYHGTGWTATKLSDTGWVSKIRARSASDAWAVGSSVGEITVNVGRPMVAHWNGTSWKIMPTPRIRGHLDDVFAASATDVWAVGDTSPSNDNGPADEDDAAVVLHYDGHTWKRVSFPGKKTTLSAVTGTSDGKLWVSGNRDTPSLREESRALLFYYDGSRWHTDDTPRATAPLATGEDDAHHVEVNSMAHVPGTKINLAVGCVGSCSTTDGIESYLILRNN